MDVGATLRRARTRKGLTLQQLARVTKISVPALDALENNDLDRLPATFYIRGFLRTCAREVGLDPEETVADYFAQFEPPRFTAAEPAGQLPQRLTLDAAPAGTANAAGRGLFSRPLPAFALAAAVVVVSIGSYLVVSRNSSGAAPSDDETREPAATAGRPPPSDAARAASTIGDSLRVELKATGPCWISASADGKAAMSGLLEAGDSRIVDAKDEVALRVGDPATLSMVINGRPARSVGRPTQPVTLHITKENFRELLTP